MEIYLLDVELLGFFSHSNPKVLVVRSSKDWIRSLPSKMLAQLPQKEAHPPLPHIPKHKHRQSVQSDSGVFLRQEGKQESPVVRGEPLLRNKSTLEKKQRVAGRGTLKEKTVMNIFREMGRIFLYMKQKEGTIKKNMQRTKMNSQKLNI